MDDQAAATGKDHNLPVDAPVLDVALVRRLQAERERHWLEVKKDNAEPEQTGRNLSAVSNGAALDGEPCGYLVWGLDDRTHQAVGTTFRPRRARTKGQELLHWLQTQLDPKHEVFVRQDGPVEGKHVAVLEIAAASGQPTRFAGEAYIRVESSTKLLKKASGKEARLWEVLNRRLFEEGVAMTGVAGEEVLELLDHTEAFRLLKLPQPDGRQAVLDRLATQQLKAIVAVGGGRYDITNVGAILLARTLEPFERLWRKQLRVIHYLGEGKTGGSRPERPYRRGYLVGFAEAIARISDQLPENEEIGEALRVEQRLFPEVAIREFVANALIHQDFDPPGTGPLVEIYPSRMVVSNPGLPLIDPLRFIDEQARSRNEFLANLMRQAGIAEERGSGVDKAVAAVELFQSPPPEFRRGENSTIVSLYGPRALAYMPREERVRACYQHSVLMNLAGQRMSNETLRRRLGIENDDYTMASRIIKDARDAGLIKGYGDGKSKKFASYDPFWA